MVMKISGDKLTFSDASEQDTSPKTNGLGVDNAVALEGIDYDTYDFQALGNGKYTTSAAATNGPLATAGYVDVDISNVNNWLIKFKSRANVDATTYTRRKVGGVWEAWAAEGATKSAAAPNHTRMGNMQVINDPALYARKTNLQVLLTEDVYGTIGATGSGADVEWASLDDVPANAVGLLLRISMTAVNSGTSNCWVALWAAHGDLATVNPPSVDETAMLRHDANSTGSFIETVTPFTAPLNSSGLCKLAWDQNACSSQTLDLSYVGFLTDD